MSKKLFYLISCVLLLGLAGSASAALPAGWNSQDIGNVSAEGSASESGGTWTITASGGDMFGSADEFHYAYTVLRGDGELSAQVTSFAGGTNDWRKAGVMIRETLDAGSRHAQIIARPGTKGISTQWRPVANNNSHSDNNGGPELPQYIKITREDNVIKGWYSSDGSSWSQQGATVYHGLPAEVYIGFALTSHQDGTLTTATFENVVLTLPNPLAAYNPGPEDWLCGAGVDDNLTWSAGDGAVSQEVWLGTSVASMVKVDTKGPGETEYEPGTLPYAQDYCWKIVETGVVESPVWTFKTEPNPAVNSDPDLIGYYRFEDDYEDSSGYGNHGTPVGTPTFVDTAYFRGLHLDGPGDGDCVDIGIGPLDQFNFTDAFTLAAWVYIEDWSTNWAHVIVSKRGEGVGWQLRRKNNNRVAFTTRRTNDEDMNSNIDPPVGEWLHVTAVYDPLVNPTLSDKRIYFNGVQQGRSIDEAARVCQWSDYTAYIGARTTDDDSGQEAHFTGIIDEVRIYKRAVEPAEIAGLAARYDALEPVPEDGDTEVVATYLDATGDTYVILNCNPGPDAVSYKAYFSTVKADVDGRDAGHLLPGPTFPAIDATGLWVGYDHANVPVFARTPLVLNQQYFWCVDVYDGDSWWKGQTWSFTVERKLWLMDPFMAEADNVSPSDGADMINPDPSATVEWSPSVMSTTGYFLSYGVHWGTNETAVASAPNTAPQAVVSGQYGQPAPQSYGITGLPRQTKIYWRLDTRLQKDTADFPTVIKDGNVWEFTTDLVISDVNCVGHWKLEDDGLAFVRDFSGYGHHGEIGGDPEYFTDPGGTYMHFDGSGDYVNCGNPTKLNDLDIREEITVACWIRSSDFVGNWRSFVSKRGEGRGWQLRRHKGNNQGCFTVRGTSGDGNGPRGSTNLRDGQWHHVAGTFSSSAGVRVLYVDGQVDDAARRAGIADAGLIAAPHSDGRDKVVIGGRNKDNNNNQFENFVTADIDDVWIFNRALKPTGIQHIMNIAQAWNPRPDDDETEVTGTTLVWNPGEDPGTGSEFTTHQLYFGDSYSDVLNKGAGVDKGEFTDVNEYPVPETLTYCRQYYWRVVEKGSVEVEGPVWSFWVMADPATTRGTINREYWLNMTAGNIAGFRANYLSLPPTGIEPLNIFEFPDYPKDRWRVNGQDQSNYGNRIHGWLYPENDGLYTFYTSSDDDSDLYLSTDETPGNATRIAWETGSSRERLWQTGSEQSAPIELEGGERYYICALHREGGGNDNLAIAWSGPDTDDQTEVICGCKLAPFINLWAYEPYPAHQQKNLPLPSVTLTWKVGIEEATGVRYPSQRVYVSVGSRFEEAYEAVKNAGPGDDEDMGIIPGTDPNELLTYFDHYDYVCWRVDGIPTSGPEVPGAVWYFTAEYDPTKLVDPNLVIWYKFEGDACDSSGYANHGTLEGDPGPTFMAGWDNLALDLDGDDDFVSTGLSASFLDIDANSPKSVCAWVYTRAFTDDGIFDVGNQSGGQEFCLRTRGGLNQWLIQYWGGNYDHQFSYPTLNEWVHFTQCYADSQTDIYVNGELFLSDVTNDGAELNTSNANPFQVGKYGWGGGGHFNGMIDDFRLYNKLLYAVDVEKIFRINMAWAWWPEPRIGLTDVSITPTLNWRPGDFTPAGMHYVYFGTDPLNLPEVAGPQAANDYTPSQLDLDTKYFWQVGEANALAPNGKDDINPIVWHFTTINNRIIDDFDLYDNTFIETAVYSVWKDGYGTDGCNGNGTGSAVQAEESTVTSEPNAMSYEYDNDGYYDYCPSNPTRPKYSVAKANVSELPSNPGPNWLQGKARALVLNFHGYPNNSIEPMWVELTDSQTGIAAVQYGPPELGEEANDVNEASWHEWNIDLADFATGPTPVDLTDVSSIAIIIGDDALPDANGTIIVDDISLYARRCVLAKRPFADLDYEDDNCIADQRERNTMMADWLLTDETVTPVAPDDGQLKAHYEFNGDTNDSTANENHGTEVGTPAYGYESIAFEANYIDLDGTEDGVDVDVASNIATGDMSMALWFVYDAIVSGNNNAVMHNNAWNAGAIHLHLRDDGDLQPDTNGGKDVRTNTALVAGDWYHVVVTFDSTATRIYLNGDLDNENTGGGNNDQLYIGSFALGTWDNTPYERWIDGAMADFRIYDYALSHGEVRYLAGEDVVYIEVPSPANLVDPELENFRSVNFSDFAELMMHYLDKQYFPLAE